MTFLHAAKKERRNLETKITKGNINKEKAQHMGSLNLK